MATITKTINQILKGICSMENYCAETEYLGGIGIDPDMPKTDSDKKSSGFIRPTSQEVLSTLTTSQIPLWIITNPKNKDVYIHFSNGNIYKTDASYTAPALYDSTATGKGNGACYYDNACYFASNNDISRIYFNANGTIHSFMNNFWSTFVAQFLNKTAWVTLTHYVKNEEVSINNYNYICLKNHTSGVFDTDLNNGYWVKSGLAYAALSNNTYPSINGVEIPNHCLFSHKGSRAMYIADVIPSDYGNTENRGKGCIHKVKTKHGNNLEGEVVDNVNYNALDLQWGMFPIAISEYQGNIVVGAIEGKDVNTNQSKARMYVWDGLKSSYDLDIPLPDPLITALRNVNGSLYVFTGHYSGGCRVLRYLGGYSFEEVYYNESEYPPLQGAVDDLLTRIIWGTTEIIKDVYLSGTTVSTRELRTPCVKSHRSKIQKIPMGVHPIIKSNATGVTSYVTAVKYIKQSSFEDMQPLIGSKGTDNCYLEKPSTTYTSGNMIKTELVKIGQDFTIESIEIPLCQTWDVTHKKFNLKVVLDSEQNVVEIPLDTGDLSASYQGKNLVKFKFDSPYTVNGSSNFYFQITFTGDQLLTIALPITYSLTIKDR